MSLTSLKAAVVLLTVIQKFNTILLVMYLTIKCVFECQGRRDPQRTMLRVNKEFLGEETI